MRVNNIAIFTNGDMSGNLTSQAFSLYQVYIWSAQFTFTGAPVGTLSVQVSDDPGSENTGDSQTPTHWTNLTQAAPNALPIAIAAAGDATINSDPAGYNWIRFIYTFTGGTGSMSGQLNTKG